MHLGMFMQPVHDPKRELTKVLEDDRETIKLADRLGYREVWVGEHTAATSEPITDPLVFLATLIGETKQIKLGTGVYCLPHHHPAQIASQAALFDHLSKGRFQMGIGNGSLSSDVELFEVGGNNDRGAMVRESIEHILAIWSGTPPYNRKGEFWNVKIGDVSRLEHGVGAFIKPYQKPQPPIAISIMSPKSSSARLAGEFGWIPISGAAFLHPRYTASHWEAYCEGAEQAGRKADSEIWRVSRSIIVAPTDEEARDYIMNPEGPFSFWFRYLLGSLKARGLAAFAAPEGHPDPDGMTWQEVAEYQVAWGSPNTVVDKLVALRDLTGPFGVLTAMAQEWDDPHFCRRSMTLLAEEVMPKFTRHAESERFAGAAE
ncbi:MAG: 3,6-diketocamphane 1,6 monooxygenase [Alphaproteobacteria bacterium MarineAlpha4_Bin2]|nr:MAG: 3,6-diketocamphane 1,6 monooxygenase [Alphaproteobacteria bacterium MarineAlpha4_Bin2]